MKPPPVPTLTPLPPVLEPPVPLLPPGVSATPPGIPIDVAFASTSAPPLPTRPFEVPEIPPESVSPQTLRRDPDAPSRERLASPAYRPPTSPTILTAPTGRYRIERNYDSRRSTAVVDTASGLVVATSNENAGALLFELVERANRP